MAANTNYLSDPDTILNALHAASNLILTTILFGSFYYHPHSTDEGTETQRLQICRWLNHDINLAPMPVFLNSSLYYVKEKVL